MKNLRITIVPKANNLLALFFLIFISVPTVLGQWKTQAFNLKPGWNAIYTHVDTLHTTIGELAQGTQVEEVWLWKPTVGTAQYINNPDLPVDSKSRWISWKSGLGDGSSALKRMPGNSAYLVKVAGNQSINWAVKGKPLPPNYQWTTSGLNFLGFPSVASNPKSIEDYLGQAGDLLRVSDIFSYQGGDLNSSNPTQVFGLRTTLTSRGQAFWIRSGTKFNRYFAPFEVRLQSPNGIEFGNRLATYRVRLKNLTKNSLTVSMTGVPSETAPSGQAVIKSDAPVLVRGALNTSDLSYAHSALSLGSSNWTLEPFGSVGSEVEVVLGLDRTEMDGGPDAFYASILRFTDSLAHAQIDIPVSGSVGTNEGLWIGNAAITQVKHSLTTDSSTYGDVAAPYPLRLILHRENLSGISAVPSEITANSSTSIGDDVDVIVNALPRPYSVGDKLVFEGGGILTLTSDAAVGATTLAGDLTVSDISIGDTISDGAIRSTAANPGITVSSEIVTSGVTALGDGVDVNINSLTRAYSAGEVLNFSGGGVLTLTTDAALNDIILTGNLTGVDIAVGETVNVSTISIANEVSVPVAATQKAYSKGDILTFSGGGELVLSMDANTGATTLYGSLSADVITDGETVTLWTAGQTQVSIAVTDTPRPLYAGEVINFSNGGKLVLTANAPANSKVLIGMLKGANVDSGETLSANRLMLMQKVFVGELSNGNSGISLKQSSLNQSKLDSARRISSIHLPVSEANLPWVCSGDILAGSSISATIDVGYNNHASNPFVHTYHPDHDNLSADFKTTLPIGRESYRIKRDIKITFQPPAGGFVDITRTGRELIGTYEESMTIIGLTSSGAPNEKSYAIKGAVIFNRINDIATLTTE